MDKQKHSDTKVYRIPAKSFVETDEKVVLFGPDWSLFMNDAEFVMTYPCYLIGCVEQKQVATKTVRGEDEVLVFSDEDLAESYLAETSGLPPDFMPLPLSESQFYEQLKMLQTTHRKFMVDYNHKTRIGNSFNIDGVLARRDDQ